MAGQCCKGPRGGVDCVRFVAGVMDELFGLNEAGSLERAPQDIGMHNPRAAALIAAGMVSRYPHSINRSGVVEPGDVIVSRVGRGPSHVLIVGPRQGTAWHAVQGAGVTMVGLGHLGNGAVGIALRTYRVTGKEQWATV